MIYCIFLLNWVNQTLSKKINLRYPDATFHILVIDEVLTWRKAHDTNCVLNLLTQFNSQVFSKLWIKGIFPNGKRFIPYFIFFFSIIFLLGFILNLTHSWNVHFSIIYQFNHSFKPSVLIYQYHLNRIKISPVPLEISCLLLKLLKKSTAEQQSMLPVQETST